MHYKKDLGTKTFETINGILLVLLGIVTLYPFLYFLVLSFNDGMDAMKGGIYIWPRSFTLANYQKAFENADIINAFKISVTRTVIGTICSLLLNSMAAYGLSQKNLPGRTLITFYFFFTTIFSGGMVPFFILMKQMHVLNTIWIYILPSLFSFFYMVILRTFFEGIPKDLSEAATIDGCSDVMIFFRIILPLSTPVLATIALYAGVGHWNEWFAGSFYVTRSDLRPAATVLQQILTEVSFDTAKAEQDANGITTMVTQTATPESLRVTFVMIITLPIILVYPFLQKYFVKGAMVGAIKS
jgi:putative aldouronate transport system permease protein